MYKIRKNVQNMQNCTKYEKMCIICKHVQNMQNCSNYAKMYKICKNTHNIQNCTKYAKNYKKNVKMFKMHILYIIRGCTCSPLNNGYMIRAEKSVAHDSNAILNRSIHSSVCLSVCPSNCAMRIAMIDSLKP